MLFNNLHLYTKWTCQHNWNKTSFGMKGYSKRFALCVCFWFAPPPSSKSCTICIVLIYGLSCNLAFFAHPSVGVNFSANNPSSSVHYAPFSPLRRCIYNPHITQLWIAPCPTILEKSSWKMVLYIFPGQTSVRIIQPPSLHCVDLAERNFWSIQYNTQPRHLINPRTLS